MRLEYFQLIDRVEGFDRAQQTIEVAAQVPAENSIFEGHFPGMPLMPGVLLIEAMAQSSGWLLIGLNGFSRMPFLAAVKEAKALAKRGVGLEAAPTPKSALSAVAASL